ncbi:hypothetical protein LZ30DRAFT_411763 [Colletotrichum cereale]|nr:hypothetical protein LZ30DRAFT_411763 [Colletotrichum cereale]
MLGSRLSAASDESYQQPTEWGPATRSGLHCQSPMVNAGDLQTQPAAPLLLRLPDLPHRSHIVFMIRLRFGRDLLHPRVSARPSRPHLLNQIISQLHRAHPRLPHKLGT